MTPLEVEIRRIKLALVRHNGRLDAMDRAWVDAGRLCCPSCMFGAKYSKLADKIERVEKWLANLQAKQGRRTR